MGKKLREKYPRYRLLIYGEGYDENKLLAMCSSLNLIIEFCVRDNLIGSRILKNCGYLGVLYM
jgi:hypothetical protein